VGEMEKLTHSTLRPEANCRPRCCMCNVQETRKTWLVLTGRLIEEYPLHPQARHGILAPRRIYRDILQHSGQLPFCVPRGDVSNSPYISVAIQTCYFPCVVDVGSGDGAWPIVRVYHDDESEAGMMCDAWNGI
jgi:hypothetical protein